MRRAERAPDLGEVLAGADELGLEEVIAWIMYGPPRPPDSAAELHAWVNSSSSSSSPTMMTKSNRGSRAARRRRKARRRR